MRRVLDGDGLLLVVGLIAYGVTRDLATSGLVAIAVAVVWLMVSPQERKHRKAYRELMDTPEFQEAFDKATTRYYTPRTTLFEANRPSTLLERIGLTIGWAMVALCFGLWLFLILQAFPEAPILASVLLAGWVLWVGSAIVRIIGRRSTQAPFPGE